MAAEIVILWPDARWAGMLQSALLRGDSRGDSKVSVQMLTRYPEEAELADMLQADGAPTRALIVGLTDLLRAEALFQTAKAVAPAVKLIAADVAESTSGLKAAMRSGATDYWAPPFDTAEIRSRLSSLAQGTAETGTLLACFPAQPGDGASTAALHLTEAIGANTGQSALLIDCDIQCGTLGFRLGLNPQYTLLDAAGHAANLDDLWEGLTTSWSGIRLLPAPERSHGLTGERLDVLPVIVESALRQFAYVVVDLPAAMYSPCAGVLRRADKVCVVCSPEITSLYLTRRRFTDLREWDVRPENVKVVVNRADSRNAAARSDIEKSLGCAVSWSLPNSYEEITKAELAGQTVDSKTEYGQAIVQMAAGLTGFQTEYSPSSWRRMLSFG